MNLKNPLFLRISGTGSETARCFTETGEPVIYDLSCWPETEIRLAAATGLLKKRFKHPVFLQIEYDTHGTMIGSGYFFEDECISHGGEERTAYKEIIDSPSNVL